jgi:hypothetical protein
MPPQILLHNSAVDRICAYPQIMRVRGHKPNGENSMEKLLAAFVTAPTDANRKRLQSHLQKHLMAICLASPAQIAFLTANGFKL